MSDVYIIAGCNGTGKTTLAEVMKNDLGFPFLNADEIAHELNPDSFNVKRVLAGKHFLRLLKKSIERKKSFILETTLSGKYLIKHFEHMKKNEMNIILIYISISRNIAVSRIDVRVAKGGHDVPVEDVLRRYDRSRANFWNHYRHQVDTWLLFDNNSREFEIVANGTANSVIIHSSSLFDQFKEGLFVDY